MILFCKFYIEKLLEKNKPSIGKMIDKSLKKENNKKEFKILGTSYQVIINKESKFSITGNIITSPNEKKSESNPEKYNSHSPNKSQFFIFEYVHNKSCYHW